MPRNRSAPRLVVLGIVSAALIGSAASTTALAQSADGGPAEAPAAGAEGGDDDLPPMMRDPRQLSGMARPEATDPPGRLTVRAVQGEMRRTEFGDIQGEFPPGAVIHLVGIDARGRVTLKSLPVDDGGRAVFDRLRVNGSEAYFALAIFPREGAEDRLSSRLITMPPEVGMRMMLAGHGKTSGKPPADDLVSDETEEGESPVPHAGQVVIDLRGESEGIREIELVEAGVDEPIARAKVEVGTSTGPPKGTVGRPVNDKGLRGGVLEVMVRRRGQGIAGAVVEIGRPGFQPGAAVGRAEVDAGGRAVLEPVPPGGMYVLRATVRGASFDSKPFEPTPATGRHVVADIDWAESQSLGARFSGVAAGNGKVYLARVPPAGQTRPFMTLPFQLTESRGAAATLIIAPPILVSFHGGASLEDDRLVFQMQFSLFNASIAPYDPGPAGVRIPLPPGFRGASVDDQTAARVKVDEDRGLVWRGPLPPGERKFIAAFSIQTVGGAVSFSMPAPFGLWNSQLVFEKIKGVKIQGPPGVKAQPNKTDDGRPVTVYRNIRLDPGDTLTMSFSGLPQHPVWRSWLRVGAGLSVLGLFGWGIWGIAARTRRGTSGRRAALQAQREDMLQAMVQLEADLTRKKISEAGYRTRRAELMKQLEGVYGELGIAPGQDAAPASRGSGAS